MTLALNVAGFWLVWRDASRGNAIANLKDKFIPLGTCYFASAKDSERAAFYQGLLSSSLLEFFHKGVAPAMPAGTVTPPRFRYKATYVETWPLVTYDTCDKIARSNLVSLVERARDLASVLYRAAKELSDLTSRPVGRALGAIDRTAEIIFIDVGFGRVTCPKPLSDREAGLVRTFVQDEFAKLERSRIELEQTKRAIDQTVLQIYKEESHQSLIERFLDRIGR